LQLGLGTLRGSGRRSRGGACGRRQRERLSRSLDEGQAPWKRIFDAAENIRGAEYYLIEQEGSRSSELETAERCLALYKKMRA
jgi:hypothetical protein